MKPLFHRTLNSLPQKVAMTKYAVNPVKLRLKGADLVCDS